MVSKRQSLSLVAVDKGSPTPLYQQIYQQFATAIEQGVIKSGRKLPSLRSLAKDLGVGRITVEKAYEQLCVEGYVTPSERSGYVANEIDTSYFHLPRPNNEAAVEALLERVSDAGFYGEATRGRSLRYNFSYFDLQPGSFPVHDWQQALAESLYSVGERRMTEYPVSVRATELQGQLCDHLARTRGVRCVPEQVVVFPGTEHALDAILRLAGGKPGVFGMEEPGYDLALMAARRNGFSVVPLATDETSEAFLDSVRASAPDVIFTTPSHQFPTGTLMPLPTRVELLRLSEELGFYVIEDDSCYEYRYGTGPVPSLQSLDARNRIIYLGNLSKTFTPALRLAYVVLPPELLERHMCGAGSDIPSVNTHIQDALARFIATGSLDRHVRRMVTSNRQRHDTLLECLRSSMGDRLSLSGVDSGMHFMARVHNGMTQEELIASARSEGAGVYGTRRFWFSRDAPDNCLMIGFSAIAPEDIAPGVEALTRAWFPSE